jgi:hypothetical protein
MQATLYILGALCELLGIVLIAAPDLVPGASPCCTLDARPLAANRKPDTPLARCPGSLDFPHRRAGGHDRDCRSHFGDQVH